LRTAKATPGRSGESDPQGLSGLNALVTFAGSIVGMNKLPRKTVEGCGCQLVQHEWERSVQRMEHYSIFCNTLHNR